MRLKWDALGFDPATLTAMADEFGHVHEDAQPGRKTRWRIYLGKRGGRPLYLSALPTRLSAKPPRFASRRAAEVVLEMMRSAIRPGETIAVVLTGTGLKAGEKSGAALSL